MTVADNCDFHCNNYVVILYIFCKNNYNITTVELHLLIVLLSLPNIS